MNNRACRCALLVLFLEPAAAPNAAARAQNPNGKKAGQRHTRTRQMMSFCTARPPPPPSSSYFEILTQVYPFPPLRAPVSARPPSLFPAGARRRRRRGGQKSKNARARLALARWSDFCVIIQSTHSRRIAHRGDSDVKTQRLSAAGSAGAAQAKRPPAATTTPLAATTIRPGRRGQDGGRGQDGRRGQDGFFKRRRRGV